MNRRVFSASEFEHLVYGSNRKLVLRRNLVFDIESVYKGHSGGGQILDRFIGKDIEGVFEG